jgi:photosystem II stability/assembly factor-like uncharacterized protein
MSNLAPKGFSNSEARLFIQRNGSGTETQVIDCIDIGDWEVPFGEVKSIKCKSGEVIAVNRQTPGDSTLEIEGLFLRQANLLEKLRCSVTMYVAWYDECIRNTFTLGNAIAVRRFNAIFTGQNMSNIMSRGTGDSAEVRINYPVVAPEVSSILRQWKTKRLNADTASNIISLDNCKLDTCADSCGPTTNSSEDLLLGIEAGDPQRSYDYGVSWVNPVTTGGSTAQNWAVCLILPNGEDRIIGLDSNTLTNLLTSDDGAVWQASVLVSDGGNKKPFQVGPQLWLGGDEFSLNYSNNGGSTWSNLIPAGNLTGTTETRDIFVTKQLRGYIIADGGLVAFSPNAATDNWVLATSPTVNDLRSILWADDVGMIVVSDATASLWRSDDYGVSWYELDRPWLNVVATATSGIYESHFLSSFEGIIILNGHIDGVPRLYRTIDGGYSWRRIALPSLGGITNLRDVILTSYDQGYVAGDGGYLATFGDSVF